MPMIAPDRWTPLAAILLVAITVPTLAKTQGASPAAANEAPKTQKPTPDPAVPPLLPPNIALAPQVVLRPSANASDGNQYFVLRNNTANPMTVGAMTVVDAFAVAGGNTTGLLPPEVRLTCGSRDTLVKLPNVIPPYSSCTAWLALPVDGPGQYEAHILVQGGASEGQTVTLQSDVRLGRGWAVFWIMLGLGIGGGIAWWTSNGRQRWANAASIRAAIEAIERLRQDPEVRSRMAALADAADDLQSRILSGDAYDNDEISEVGQRVRYARFLLGCEQRAGRDSKVRAATTAALAILDPAADGRLLPPVNIAAVNAAAATIADAKPKDSTEAAVAAGAAVPIPITATSSAIRQAGTGIELVVALAIGCVFAAMALPSIYDNQPHWGSFNDQFAAFLIGFGAFAGSLAGVNAFLARSSEHPKPA